MRRIAGWPARRVRLGASGQMTVEAAMSIPLLLVSAYVVANLMLFVEACGEFDRIALDAVVSQGVSPSGELTEDAACAQVRSCIEDAMGHGATCSVDVSAKEEPHGWAEGASFSLFPGLTRYECTLSYRPWPGSFSIAGVSFSSPALLTHTRSLVVDRYRAGVVA